MNEQVERDAQEFGLHVRQGGWRLGLLVARNVEKGKGEGRPPRNRRDRDGFEKVSAREFARASGTTGDRVLRYLDAWERAAELGLVQAAGTLTPGHEIDLDVDSLPAWDDYYDASGAKVGGYNGKAGRLTPTVAESEARKLIEAHPEVVAKVAGEQVGRDADFARAMVEQPNAAIGAAAAVEERRAAARSQVRSERRSREGQEMTAEERDGLVMLRVMGAWGRARHAAEAAAREMEDTWDELTPDGQETLLANVLIEIERMKALAEAAAGHDLDAALNQILAESGGH